MRLFIIVLSVLTFCLVITQGNKATMNDSQLYGCDTDYNCEQLEKAQKIMGELYNE